MRTGVLAHLVPHGWLGWAGAVILLCLPPIISASSSESNDYCVRESFNASCPEGHVVLMTSAQYGRMHQGRCTKNLNIGCFATVLEHMDSLCSGKQRCEVPVRKLMDFSQPCAEDFTSFLTATYECVKVASPKGPEEYGECPLLLTDQMGYIQHPNSFTLPGTITPGTPGCAYKIKVDPTQQIKITLIDFGLLKPDTNKNCPMYMVAEEGLERDNEIGLCNHQGRERALLTTSGDEVTIRFVTAGLGPPKNTMRFLLRFEAVGCRQLVVGEGLWVREDSRDVMAVVCNRTEETWYLTCVGNHWSGDVGNCTEGPLRKQKHAQDGNNPFPYGIIIAVIVGVLLGILIGSLLLALVYGCFKRRQSHTAMASAQETMLDPSVRFSSVTTDTTYPSLLKSGGSPRNPSTGEYSSAYGYDLRYPDTPSHAIIGGQGPGPNTTKIDITAKLTSESGPRRHDHVYESASLPSFARFAVAGQGMGTPGTVHQHRLCPEYYELETEDKNKHRHVLAHAQDCRLAKLDESAKKT